MTETAETVTTSPTFAPISILAQTQVPIQGTDSPQNVEVLITILYASDPELPHYDPQSTSFARFAGALQQLSAMVPDAVDAASHIAHAISFPRDDAYLAAQTLISLGPKITATTLGILIDNLKVDRPASRLYSVMVLSTVGEQALCAVGDIGPLLWDADSSVRSMSAFALERITGSDLLADDVELNIDNLSKTPIIKDTPEGKIIDEARRWWTEEGSKINWHPTYGMCDP